MSHLMRHDDEEKIDETPHAGLTPTGEVMSEVRMSTATPLAGSTVAVAPDAQDAVTHLCSRLEQLSQFYAGDGTARRDESIDGTAVEQRGIGD